MLGLADDSIDPLFADLSADALDRMLEAGAEVVNCQRVLAKTGDTVVGELLRDRDGFFEWQHYPPGDVYDPEFHAQYYYHAHPAAERAEGEHGHFHTFLRPLGMPPGCRPSDVPDLVPPKDPNDALSHLIGISMDRHGRPIRLFTTNRWVTGETWYAADDVIAMLDHFAIDHARPSWATNRWITAMIRLFRPQIAALLRERDEAVAHYRGIRPQGDVFEDRALEVTSEQPISVPAQIDAIEHARRALRRRRGTR